MNQWRSVPKCPRKAKEITRTWKNDDLPVIVAASEPFLVGARFGERKSQMNGRRWIRTDPKGKDPTIFTKFNISESSCGGRVKELHCRNKLEILMNNTNRTTKIVSARDEMIDEPGIHGNSLRNATKLSYQGTTKAKVAVNMTKEAAMFDVSSVHKMQN